MKSNLVTVLICLALFTAVLAVLMPSCEGEATPARSVLDINCERRLLAEAERGAFDESVEGSLVTFSGKVRGITHDGRVRLGVWGPGFVMTVKLHNVHNPPVLLGGQAISGYGILMECSESACRDVKVMSLK